MSGALRKVGMVAGTAASIAFVVTGNPVFAAPARARDTALKLTTRER